MNAQRKILIIEDEPTYREFLTRTLSNDYLIDLATDGNKALDLLRCGCYDAVLCDLRVPGIPGKELVHYMRKHLDEHLVIIIITGYEDDWPPAEATDQQVYYYLRKGAFSPKELKKILANGLLFRDTMIQRKQYEEALAKANAELERIVQQRTERLKESEDLYRNLFEHALVGVYVLQEGVITLANQKLCEILHASRDEVIGNPLSRFLASSCAGSAEPSTPVNRPHAHVPHEITIRTAEGSQRLALHCAGTVMFNGQLAIQGSILDITEWRQLEQQFLQHQKMESIGTLVGTLAHEFNNILTAIMPHAELIRHHARNQPAVIRSADTIEHMGQRASDLLRQLLGITRKSDFTIVRINPNDRIRASLGLISVTLGPAIELAIDLDPSVEAIDIDPNQMDQMLLNLVINARDAMPDGGRLTITTRRLSSPPPWMLELDTRTHTAQLVELTIADTGIGIRQEVLGRIFDPFFTTKEPGKGTGLGLTTVYDIVRRHGGQIRVESELGHGTVFRVVFPMAEVTRSTAVVDDEHSLHTRLKSPAGVRDLSL